MSPLLLPAWLDDDDKKGGRCVNREFKKPRLEAKSALGVYDIIDDDSWHDSSLLAVRLQHRLQATFSLADEAVHLRDQTVSRQNNYDVLLQCLIYQ